MLGPVRRMLRNGTSSSWVFWAGKTNLGCDEFDMKAASVVPAIVAWRRVIAAVMAFAPLDYRERLIVRLPLIRHCAQLPAGLHAGCRPGVQRPIRNRRSEHFEGGIFHPRQSLENTDEGKQRSTPASDCEKHSPAERGDESRRRHQSNGCSVHLPP